jgi:hypothetical protein
VLTTHYLEEADGCDRSLSSAPDASSNMACRALVGSSDVT